MVDATAAPETDAPAGSDDDAPAGDGADLATTIREVVTDTFNTLLGRSRDDDEPEGDDVADAVTAPGKTAAERARRGPTREQSVAEETRAELERIRKQENADAENASLRAEIERQGEQLKTLAEKPPEQYNRLTKALWK